MWQHRISDILFIGTIFQFIPGNGFAKMVADVVDRACLPEGTDRLVYRYQNGSHVMVGFDALRKKKLYSMTWELNVNDTDILKTRESNWYDVTKGGDYRNDLDRHVILAATDLDGQKEFKAMVDVCQEQKMTVECLMEALARAALNMKKVRISHRKCYNRHNRRSSRQ